MSDLLQDAGGYSAPGPYWWWHTWTGVSGLHYAWRLRSSPPVVLKARDRDLLLLMVKQWIITHDDRPVNPGHPACNLGQRRVTPGLATTR